MSSLLPLTPPQEQVLALISAGSTISHAAESAGIHRNTVHNWINSSPQFRLAIAGAREAKAFYWRDQAEQLAASAIETIRAILTDASTPPAVRLRAAQSILNLVTTPPPPPPEPDPASFFGRLLDSMAAAPPAMKTVHNSAQSIPERSPAPAAVAQAHRGPGSTLPPAASRGSGSPAPIPPRPKPATAT
jgi:hypothetical protein